MQWNEGGKTFLTGAASIYKRRLVKLSSGTVIHNTATYSDRPIGVTEDLQATSGGRITVRPLNKEGTLEMTAAGAITQDADVYAAAAGKIQALPTAAGTYLRIGIAIDAATADGDIIEVLPIGAQSTTAVT